MLLEIKDGKIEVWESTSLESASTEVSSHFIMVEDSSSGNCENDWIGVLRPRCGFVTASDIENKTKIVPDGTHYVRALEIAGGEDSVAAHSKLSEALESKIKMAHVYQNSGVISFQRSMVMFTGMNKLYKQALAVRPRFEKCIETIAEITGGKPIVAPMKDRQRSEFKCFRKYGSDFTRLIDLLRATIYFQTIDLLYDGLSKLNEDGWFDIDSWKSCTIVGYEDRMQPGSRLSAGYGDIQLKLAVDEHVCELQLNVASMSDAKYTGGHSNYGKERVNNERLLLAAMREQMEDRFDEEVEDYRWGVRSLLERGASPGGSKDKNGCTALHYAAFFGCLEMVNLLLEHGANPVICDHEHKTPLHSALMNMNIDVTHVLLEQMLTNEKYKKKIEMSWCEPKAKALRLVQWAFESRPYWPESEFSEEVILQLKALQGMVEPEGKVLQIVPKNLRGVQFTSRSINLKGILKSDIDFDFLCLQLKYHPFIERVDAQSCMAGPKAMRGLRMAKHLRYLNLGFGVSSVECLDALAEAIEGMASLEELHINNNYNLFGKGALEAVAKFGLALCQPKNFHTLNVGGHNRIFETDEGLQTLIKHLGEHPTLRSFSVFNNTDYSPKCLGELGGWAAKLPVLSHLNMSAGCLRQEKGSEAFAKAIKSSSTLVKIDTRCYDTEAKDCKAMVDILNLDNDGSPWLWKITTKYKDAVVYREIVQKN